MNIEFIPRDSIDKTKWNSCVHYAGNGNIFGYMWYLDHIAKDWDALIEGDYESVFPLVWKENRRGSRQLVHPPLMRELGIYSINALSSKRVRSFLEAIPAAYQSVTIQLNEQNRLPELEGFSFQELTNQQLLLNRPYEEIETAFSDSFRADLIRAEAAGLVPGSGIKPEAAADFYRDHSQDRQRREHYHGLLRIMYNVLHRGWGFLSSMTDREGNLLAVSFFIYSHSKMMRLFSAESKTGKEKGALSYLYNLLIHSHAGRHLLLDFNLEKPDELATDMGAVNASFYRIKKGRTWLNL